MKIENEKWKKSNIFFDCENGAFNPYSLAPKMVSPCLWILLLRAKSGRMWYVRILWRFIYKLRPF
jgi:hypothetical protein